MIMPRKCQICSNMYSVSESREELKGKKNKPKTMILTILKENPINKYKG